MTSPKSLISLSALVGALVVPSTAFAFTDWGALAQRILLLITTEGTKAVDYYKTYEEWDQKRKDLMTDVSKLTEKYNELLKGPEPQDIITIDQVKAMIANPNTTPSLLAKYYFPDQTACKQSATSLVGSIVGSSTSSPKAMLEQICLKQKELAAMATQENLNYNIIISSYEDVIKSIKAEKPEKTGERGDVSHNLAAFIAEKEIVSGKHSTLLAYIQNQSDNLQKNQRDVEMVMMRGKSTFNPVLANAAQNAIIAGIISGTSRGVKGVDSSRAYAN